MLSVDTEQFLELAASRPEELWRAEFAQALTAINRQFGRLGLIVLFTLLRRLTHPDGGLYGLELFFNVLLAPTVHRVGGSRRSPVDSDSAFDALDNYFAPRSPWAAFGAVLAVLLQPSEPRAGDLRHGAGGSGATRDRGRMER